MSETARIIVSPTLYQALWSLRDPSDRTMEDVLWRLAETHGIKRTEPVTAERGWHSHSREEGLYSSNVTIPNGAKLRARYRGALVEAVVEGGKIVFGEGAYDSPSGAARAVLAQHGLTGAAGNVNGWKFWEWEYPAGSGQWRQLDTFRMPWDVKHTRYYTP